MTDEEPPLPPSVFADVAKTIGAPVTPRSTYRQCRKSDGTEKQRYPNETAALSGVRALQARPQYVHDPKRPLNAYECPRCGSWHIGKIPQKRKRKR